MQTTLLQSLTFIGPLSYLFLKDRYNFQHCEPSVAHIEVAVLPLAQQCSLSDRLSAHSLLLEFVTQSTVDHSLAASYISLAHIPGANTPILHLTATAINQADAFAQEDVGTIPALPTLRACALRLWRVFSSKGSAGFTKLSCFAEIVMLWRSSVTAIGRL